MIQKLLRGFVAGLLSLVIFSLVATHAYQAHAQDESAESESAEPSEGSDADMPQGPGIEQRQAQVADNYKRLEELLIRLADVEAATHPERAALLRRAARQSSETFVLKQLETASDALQNRQFQLALDNQSSARDNLASLLKLLLSEDRQERIRDEKDRIKRIKKEMERQLRRQIATRSRTERNGDANELEKEQGQIADKTEEISKELGAQESEGKESEGKDSEGKESEGKDSEGKDSEGKDSEGKESEGKESEGKDSEGKDSEGKDSEGKDSEGKDSEGKESEGKDSEGQQSEGQQSEGQQSEGQQSEGQQSEGQQSEGQQSQGQQQQQPQTPQQSAAQRLQKAQQKMREAQEQLEKAKREEAVDKQREAEQLVRQAIDDLERILRQLREEERERELARLEARFRKMAEMQAEVYEKTRELGEIPEEARDRSVDIRAGNLAFEEKKIVLEADRALLVLKEEGSSVAFPEVVDQMRGDMQTIADRLAKSKVDVITQGLEEDVLAALEEMIAALEKAQRDLEEQRANQGQQQGQQGQQGEDPLVESIAELKLIRTLETRIKKTTERYARIIPKDAKEIPGDLLDLINNLSDRQLRLYRVTRDIVLKKNR